MTDKALLTSRQCSDPVEIKDRTQDVLDRYFLDPHQATGAWNALHHEVIKPLLARLKKAEAKADKVETPPPGLMEMVAEFNSHFGVPQAGSDHRLPYDLQVLRLVHLREELDEYKEAVEAGDMEKAYDALIDLVYVALGTSFCHDFKFDEGFGRVHAVNMLKKRAEKASDSKRGSRFDVVKPEGWAPAALADLL